MRMAAAPAVLPAAAGVVAVGAPLTAALLAPVVTPGTAVGGVSLMPRGNGLSLTLERTVVPPAAAVPSDRWIATAGLCGAAMTPLTGVVPTAVGSTPPVSAMASCCAVGVAMRPTA
jgi:hypothetical protein